MNESKDRPRKVRRALAVAVAGATLGVSGAFAVAAAQEDATPTSCGPTASDLMRAAEAARQLEIERPELFGDDQQRANYDDLRLAAEWARRLSILRPIEGC
jgi:hypothetical protein